MQFYYFCNYHSAIYTHERTIDCVDKFIILAVGVATKSILFFVHGNCKLFAICGNCNECILPTSRPRSFQGGDGFNAYTTLKMKVNRFN